MANLLLVSAGDCVVRMSCREFSVIFAADPESLPVAAHIETCDQRGLLAALKCAVARIESAASVVETALNEEK